MRSGKDLTAEIAFLARELKTPVIAETFTTLGDQAREAGWSHEEYGTRMRISAAHFPQVKTMQDFVFDHIPATTRDVIAYLATCTFRACCTSR